MKIEWTNDTEIEIVTDYNESNDHLESENVRFYCGQTSEIDVLDDYGEYVDVQFPNGSVCYSLSKKLFRIIKD